MRFYILTVGCPKNEVDSEGLACVLERRGHQQVHLPGKADALIVNTCCFIDSARRESAGMIHYLTSCLASETSSSSKGSARYLVAVGCWAEREGAELLAKMPQLHAVLGTHRWSEIGDLLEQLESSRGLCWTGPARVSVQVRRQVPGPSIFVKIADGCDAGCTFCAIPAIKGPLHSRPVAEIVAEIITLTDRGAREVVLIAQDTTAYGRDFGWTDGLALLLEEIARSVPELAWLRVLYAHPQGVSQRLLETMAYYDSIVKYLDLPLQHADAEVLARMGRPPQHPRELVKRIRETVPGIALRTTLIVGFPGETERQFRTLLDFVEEARFERLGVFTYSQEEGTAAANLVPLVREPTADRRYRRVMELQQQISLEKNQALEGQVLDVLIGFKVRFKRDKRKLGDFFGRTYRDAPEIDGKVYVRGDSAVGEIVPVRITQGMQYDLRGEVVVQ